MLFHSDIIFQCLYVRGKGLLTICGYFTGGQGIIITEGFFHRNIFCILQFTELNA